MPPFWALATSRVHKTIAAVPPSSEFLSTQVLPYGVLHLVLHYGILELTIIELTDQPHLTPPLHQVCNAFSQQGFTTTTTPPFARQLPSVVWAADTPMVPIFPGWSLSPHLARFRFRSGPSTPTAQLLPTLFCCHHVSPQAQGWSPGLQSRMVRGQVCVCA